MTASKTSGFERRRASDGRFLPVDPARSATPHAAALAERGVAQGWGLANPLPATEDREFLEDAKAIAGTEWGTIRSWPFESGLVWLAEKMKG